MCLDLEVGTDLCTVLVGTELLVCSFSASSIFFCISCSPPVCFSFVLGWEEGEGKEGLGSARKVDHRLFWSVRGTTRKHGGIRLFIFVDDVQS